MSGVRLCVAAFLTFGLFLAGCGEKKDEAANKKSDVMKPINDDHGHSHGPHYGEWFELKGADLWGEARIRAGDNLVTIYIYDKDQKTLKKIVADKLVASIAGKDSTIEIPAKQTDDGGATNEFEIVDEQLVMAFKTAGFKVDVEIEGKTYTGAVPKDPHP